MKEIFCVAIDDEPIALEIISNYCSKIDNAVLTGFTDPNEALKYIQKNKTDIVFLDIEMNDVSGLQLAKKLPEQTSVIFTTAFMNYALEGFNLDAVDFLHKPFSFERFKEAFQKAIRRIEYNSIINCTGTIIVKEKYNNVSIPLKDIRYIAAMENYSKIHLKDDTVIIAHNLLKNLADQLPSLLFIRIHKSYIVPTKDIKTISRKSLTLNSGETFPIGRQYVDLIFTK